MADTITVTLDLRYPQKAGGYGKIGVISGSANLTSYSTSKTTLTAVNALFRNLYRVVTDGVSSNGYAVRWDTAAKAFRAYDTGAASGNALAEAVNATNVGTFNFLAIGQIATGG